MAPADYGAMTPSLLDEVLALSRRERDDLAIRLIEITALRQEGEIDDEEYVERRAGIYRAQTRCAPT